MHPRHFRLSCKCTYFGSAAPFSFIGVAYLYLQVIYESYQQSSAAFSLNATPIPRVVGKWPGNLDIMLRMVQNLKKGYPMQVFADLFEQYNCQTLNLRVLWDDVIITIDESNVKFMLTGPSFPWFPKGYWWQERMECFLGNGIFNSDGEIWQMHRNYARPFFAKERVSDFAMFEEHMDRTLSVMKKFAGDTAANGQAFDMQDLFNRITLDVSSEFLTGSSLNSLSEPLPVAGEALLGPKGSMTEDEFGTFTSAFESVQVVMAERFRLMKHWPILELFKDKTRANMQVIHDWLKTYHAEMIRHQILNMLVAGRDTTSALLTFAIYFLCIYPSVKDRLRAEILEYHGRDGRPTYDSDKNLKYMRAVLNETLRLFPPISMNARTSDSSPHAFPPSSASKSSQFIPPGTQIMYSPFLLGRRVDLWGEDANDFNPDRWLDPERLKNVTTNPFIFTPFHAGPRICLGQNFAYHEVTFVLVGLLQRFQSFVLAPEYQPHGSLPPRDWLEGKGRQSIEKCWPASSVTLFVKGGLWVKCVEASYNE
ncbi:cytochrome P450 [Ramaria rubella]|nr:cytochrome P450 [Ramaria rubella]